MKRKAAGILIGMLAGTFVMIGCGTNKATAAEAKEAKEEETEQSDEAEQEEEAALKVGVFLPGDEEDERWTLHQQAIEEDLTEAGYESVTYRCKEDADLQIRQIEEALEEEYAAFIVAPEDVYALTDVLAKVKEQGIPVFDYDRLIMNTDGVSYYAAFDFREIGHLIGKEVISRYQLEKADAGETVYHIEFLMGSPEDNEALFLYGGLMEELQPYFESGVLVSLSGAASFDEAAVMGWDAELAAQKTKKLLEEVYGEQKLDILCTAYDGMALGAAAVLQEAGYVPGTEEWPLITGLGSTLEGVKAVMDQRLAFTFYFNPEDLAQRCTKMVDTCLKGETPEVDNYEQYDNGMKIIGTNICLPTRIDRDNEKMLIDSGVFREEELEGLPDEELSVPATSPTPVPTSTPTPVPTAVPTPTVTPEPTAVPEAERSIFPLEQGLLESSGSESAELRDN